MSKRGENIYKRKDGRWEGRYIKERSADGKARYAYVYGKSYADAKQKLLDRRIAQAQNIDCSPSHTKYGDILRNWIAMSRVHIKESTYSRYVHLANVHILPYLGELPTDKLTTQTVEKHISFLLNKGRVDKKGGLAPKTVSDILTLIKGSIDYANCSGYSVNCYLDRLTVKKTQLDMRVLSIDEQHRLCDILMRDMNLTKFGVLLCMYTGIRIGEVCALKWESIDFSEGILSIRETLQRIQATDVGACKKTKIVITEPKSKKAIRDIPLPGFVLEYAASLKHNPKAYILTGCSDRYIEPRSLQYTFKKYTKECGLTDVNYHALRHTFATRCIELGFDVKTLSELLGHSSVNITLNRYVHSSMDTKRMLAEIRSYGVGLIIADQSPRKVTTDVVALTDIKVAFRLVEASDKQILAESIDMDDTQVSRLTKLKPGEAFFFFNKLEAPEEIVTPNYRLENNISITLSDEGIRSLSTYWSGRETLLRPYPECCVIPYCLHTCDYNRRVLAKEIARRIFVRHFKSDMKDFDAVRKVFGHITKLVISELNDEPFDKQLLACVKAQLWRRIKYGTKIPVTDQLIKTSLEKA